MELELHQLELRYERLRKRAAATERALLGSLAEHGQQLPIVVVSEQARFIVIDGYKRVRALQRLSRDTVRAADWRMAELEALLLERQLRCGSEDALDQAWLLAELQERFGLSLEALAQRFGRSKSWVSRRLGLLQALPASIHDQVRAGELAAHAAMMKYLLPLARANAPAAAQLAAAIAPLKLTSRQVGALYSGWQSGTQRTRELILERPQVYLQAQCASTPAAPSASERWLQDLHAIAGIARRARRTLEGGLLQQLLDAQRAEMEQGFERMRADVQRLFNRFDLEGGHTR
jgi:ParB family transcriptional regulator, chromosome partitioning protein